MGRWHTPAMPSVNASVNSRWPGSVIQGEWWCLKTEKVQRVLVKESWVHSATDLLSWRPEWGIKDDVQGYFVACVTHYMVGESLEEKMVDLGVTRLHLKCLWLSSWETISMRYKISCKKKSKKTELGKENRKCTLCSWRPDVLLS